jgi:hypothetical protein
MKMLSCDCSLEWDPEPGDWEFDAHEMSLKFEPLNTSKRKRCCSCKKLIDINEICVKFSRSRHTYTEIEARIHGVDWECFEEPVISIADFFHCEWCGEMYQNFMDLGYDCLQPDESMKAALKEYWEMTGFEPITASTG